MTLQPLEATVKTVLYGDVGLLIFAYLDDWLDAFHLMLLCKTALQASWMSLFLRLNRYHLCRFEEFKRIHEVVENIKYCEYCYENGSDNLKRLSSLKDISLENCPIDRITIPEVGPRLWHLNATQSFSGMSSLSNCCNLRVLNLTSVRLESFSFLKQMKHLDSLYIDNSDEYLVTDYLPSDWQPFENVASSLRYLHISSPRDSDHKLDPALSRLCKLQNLYLHFHSIQDFVFLKSLESLETLAIVIDESIDSEHSVSPIPSSYYTHLFKLVSATCNDLNLLL